MTRRANNGRRKVAFATLPDVLARLNQYVLGAAVLCYVTGFIITNLHLGSLGIVNIDVLRTRYILTGALFTVFLGLIVFLVYGFVRVMETNRGGPLRVLIWSALTYSAKRAAFLLGVGLLLRTLVGLTANPSLGVLSSSSTLPWGTWLKAIPGELRSTAISAVYFDAAVLLLGVLVFLAIVIINPASSDGGRLPRKKRLWSGMTWVANPRNLMTIFKGLLIPLAILPTSGIIGSLINFVTTSRVTAMKNAHGLDLLSGLSGGVDRFVGAVFGIYALVALMIALPASSPNGPGTEADDDVFEERSWDPTGPYASAAFLLMYIAGIVLPVYSFGVYPHIPQQIGGGRLAKVEVVACSEQLTELFSEPTTEIYLIDRAASGSFFLVANKQQRNRHILEVANSQIQSIIFSVLPEEQEKSAIAGKRADRNADASEMLPAHGR